MMNRRDTERALAYNYCRVLDGERDTERRLKSEQTGGLIWT